MEFKEYNKDCDRIQKKWETHLANVHNRQDKRTIAVVLENQKIYSEENNVSEEIQKDLFELSFQVFSNLGIFNMVGCQPMLNNNRDLFTLCFKLNKNDNVLDLYENISFSDIEDSEISLVIQSEELTVKQKHVSNVSNKSTWLEDMSQEIRCSIIKEIIQDLRKQCGTIGIFTLSGVTFKELYEEIYVKLSEISDIIHQKTLRGGSNVIMVGKDIGDVLGSATTGWCGNPSYISYLGTIMHRFRTYICDELAPHEILLAHKGDSFMDSGFFYNPYMLTCDGSQIFLNYSKRLTQSGSKYYGKLMCEGLK